MTVHARPGDRHKNEVIQRVAVNGADGHRGWLNFVQTALPSNRLLSVITAGCV